MTAYCQIGIHPHLTLVRDYSPFTDYEEKVYAVTLHEKNYGDTPDVRWSIGIIVGSTGSWRALLIGDAVWSPAFRSRGDLATALQMARGEHDSWGRQRRLAPQTGTWREVAPEVTRRAEIAAINALLRPVHQQAVAS